MLRTITLFGLAIPILFPLLAKAQPQEQGQLDSSLPVFTVLAAVNAAGYDVEAGSAVNHPLRKILRDNLASKDLHSLPALKRFVRDHRQKDPGAELSQYISYALVLNGPPDFSYRYAQNALPPEVVSLDGLTPLLIEFYREAHLDELWRRSQPYFDEAIAKLQAPVVQAVLQANAYLRNATSGSLGRSFQIYVDLLGAPNQVQSRSYVNDYFVVVTPAGEPPIEQIRHAYLHYLIDPLPLRFADLMMTKRGLGDYALGAPALEEQYKTDFILLATECLIKAVESRINRNPALIDQALHEGFVMTPAFAEQLVAYEKQEVTMRLFFPELVAGIDLRREEQRLDNLSFTSERSNKKIRTVTSARNVELTGAAKTLEDAEKAYAKRELGLARETYLNVLKETSDKPMHAKAYYGLARVAVLERDPETGDRLFRKALELEPDPETKSWSLLYLGRLADSQHDREQAQEHYKAVLAVQGAPDSVRQAAQKGLQEAFKKQ